MSPPFEFPFSVYLKFSVLRRKADFRRLLFQMWTNVLKMTLCVVLMKNVLTTKGPIRVCAEQDIGKRTKFAQRKVNV